mgnify:CR=1 FL=1
MVRVVVGVFVVLPLDEGILAVKVLVLQLARDRPVRPACTSAMAALIASWALLDLGLVATRMTASASGSRASGRPTMLAASMAALTMGMICG